MRAARSNSLQALALLQPSPNAKWLRLHLQQVLGQRLVTMQPLQPRSHCDPNLAPWAPSRLGAFPMQQANALRTRHAPEQPACAKPFQRAPWHRAGL